MENFIYSVHTALPCRRDRLWNPSKTAHLLNQIQISELTMDSNSDESLCDMAAMVDEEYCALVLLQPHL
jgi:hypothetical protein